MSKHVKNSAAEICIAAGHQKMVEIGSEYPAAVGILSAKINSLLLFMDSSFYSKDVESLKKLIHSTFDEICEEE